MRRPLSLAFLLLALTAAEVSAQRLRPVLRPFGASVNPLATRALERPVPGIVVGVMHRGRVLVERGYGEAAPGVPAWGGSVFQVGSITKQMTAAGILRLQEQGKLSLDDDVRTWIPSLDTRGHVVTLRHLLSHTSSIPEFLVSVEDFWAPITTDEVIRLTNALPWQSVPGHRFTYNNTGFVLLGAVIERASGLPWSEYLRRELFVPLGMTSTGVCGEPAPGEVPTGYLEVSRGVVQPITPIDMTIPGAAGAICSTVGDLMRWSDGLVHGRALSAESFAEMTTPATLNDGRQLSYGLGIGLSTNPWGKREIEHGGSILGFQSVLVHDLDQDLVMVVLVNITPMSGAPASDLVNEIIRTWNLAPPRPYTLPEPPSS